jgi:hypothetical protein
MDSIKKTIDNSLWSEKKLSRAIDNSSIVNRKDKPVENPTDGKLFDIPPPEADLLIERVRDLIDDPDYDHFFYKQLYRLGPAKFLDLADQARRKQKPGKWFSKTLKYEQG